MDENKLFEKLDKIIKLLAISAISGKSFREQVKILSDQGLQPSEIAEVTGKTANFVRVTKSELNKKSNRSD